MIKLHYQNKTNLTVVSAQVKFSSLDIKKREIYMEHISTIWLDEEFTGTNRLDLSPNDVIKHKMKNMLFRWRAGLNHLKHGLCSCATLVMKQTASHWRIGRMQVTSRWTVMWPKSHALYYQELLLIKDATHECVDVWILTDIIHKHYMESIFWSLKGHESMHTNLTLISQSWYIETF